MALSLAYYCDEESTADARHLTFAHPNAQFTRSRNAGFETILFVACDRAVVARPFDARSAVAGGEPELVAEAGCLSLSALPRLRVSPNKRRCQPERTLPPKQGLEK